MNLLQCTTENYKDLKCNLYDKQNQLIYIVSLTKDETAQDMFVRSFKY
jgi:hypothetical protein